MKKNSKTAQPAVAGLGSGRNTGSSSALSPPGSGNLLSRDRAVGPRAAGVREPAAARDVSCSIGDDGALVVSFPLGPQYFEVAPGIGCVEFSQEQTEAIGDFLRLTEPLWKP
jgi:hypothetical protein